MRKFFPGFSWFTAFFIVSASLSSCINTKNITYFNNLPDSANIALNTIVPPQPLIQINDVLEIRIGGENEKTVQYINQYFGSAGGSTSGSALQSIVDIDGNIELPKIGKLKVAGLTRDAARDTITHAYAEYLKDPIVSIKFGNFRFSVLGEVKSPGTYSVSNEKVNLFEAVAQAGDMTEYSARNNVKIIREDNGQRRIITVDFNDRSILNSPYYYLNRYDIIYVQAGKTKSVTDNVARTATYVATITSILALFLVIFKK